MNMGRFSEIFGRFKFATWSRTKKIVILTAGGISLLLFIILISSGSSNKQSEFNKVTLIPKDSTPKKDLNYEFIKFDTIKIPNFALAEEPFAEPPKNIESVTFTENTKKPAIETSTIKKPVKSSPKLVQPGPAPSQQPISLQTRSANQSPNMIVTNNLSENKVQGGSSTPTFTGMQSALVKVVLSDRTPVANGSLVEARVLREAKWGNMFIPKRTKLIGTASLYNQRVNIDFQEIVINGTGRSCRGRAYDLKRLQGIQYSPVNSEAKRVLLEELRDVVSGVPVLGRVANRATYSSNYSNQDVSVLDEGLEFYVMIESIY